MAYPILAPSNTWFIPNDTTITRSIITEIEIMDSYTPDASVTVRDSWDASEAKDGSITCYVIGTKLIIAGNGSGKIAANEDSSYWFGYNNEDWTDYDIAENVERIIGISFLNTSNVRNFNSMFYYFQKIKELDLSTFDTSSATDLTSMFHVCAELTSLNISNWDTSKVTTTHGMFGYCYLLEYVDGLDELDTSNVTTFKQMFAYSKISNFTNLNTSKVTDMSFTFMGYGREVFTFPNWDTSNVKTFQCCFTGQTVSVGSTIKTLDLSNFKYIDQAILKHMFLHLNTATTIILPPNFGKSTSDLSNMFYGCTNLKNINSENIDTSDATSLSGMFEGCSSLEKLDVSKWDVSKVEDMGFMFWGCSRLNYLDVTNWNVSKVTTLDHFAAHANMKRKGMEKWNTSSLVNANAAFHNCGEEELDLSGWDVSNVQFFDQMFENSQKLKRVKGLEKWDTSNGLGFDQMFERCYKLEEVDLSNFDTRKAKNNIQASPNGHKTMTLQNMFKDCYNLKKVKLGANFSINGDGTNTTASYKFILPTPSSDYIDGADGYWYTFNGEKFGPTEMKDKTAETYYASYNLIADEDVIVKNGSMLETAKAIRTANGTDNRYLPSQFAKGVDSVKNKHENVIAGLIDGSITEITIPDDITSIRPYAFYHCADLELESLPESITKIGDKAFEECSKITLTSLPKHITEIGSCTFYNCYELALSSLPEGITKIGDRAFYYCRNLTLTELPPGITVLDTRTFNACANLPLRTLPEGLTTIKNAAFYSCISLALTELPKNITDIGTEAFRNCASLTELTFKGTPTTIASNVFIECNNLTTINVPWSEGEVDGAPWGATNATINYNYTEET